MNKQQLVFLDYDAVGMSIHGHPMESLRERLERGGATDSRKLMAMPNGKLVTVAGLVTVRQQPETANGTIFLLLEDEWGYMNIVVSRAMVVANEEAVKRADFIVVQGRVENDGAAISVVGKRFKELEVEKLTHQAHAFH
jgi:error-prone DNA polymerase